MVPCGVQGVDNIGDGYLKIRHGGKSFYRVSDERKKRSTDRQTERPKEELGSQKPHKKREIREKSAKRNQDSAAE